MNVVLQARDLVKSTFGAKAFFCENAQNKLRQKMLSLGEQSDGGGKKKTIAGSNLLLASALMNCWLPKTIMSQVMVTAKLVAAVLPAQVATAVTRTKSVCDAVTRRWITSLKFQVPYLLWNLSYV